MSLPPEILKKVKLLEIATRKLVNNTFSGEYHSAFKGQGMTFSEFREYVPGDDVRTISWPVTARTGKPFIKKFDEERELTLMLCVDISGSTDFGTGNYFKGEVMAHLAALLSFSASKNNDPVGLLLFSDQVEHFVPPKKGRGHILRLLRDLYYFEPKSKKTNIGCAVEYLQGVLKKRSNVFIFSDFMGDLSFDKPLRMIGKKHDTIAVCISDPFEEKMPALGLIEFEDAETGELRLVDTSSAFFQKKIKEIKRAHASTRNDLLKKAQVDFIEVNSQEDIAGPLIGFFKRRNRG